MKNFRKSRRQKREITGLVLIFFFWATIITTGLLRLEFVLRAAVN